MRLQQAGLPGSICGVWVWEVAVDWVLVLLAPPRRRRSRKVTGHAMEPLIPKGKRVALRSLMRNEPRVGQVVVARVGDREVVQRIKADTTYGFELAGDNRGAGEDAGLVVRDQIVGVVDAPSPLLRLFRRRPRAQEM